jgi:hypothetical protein
MIKTKVKVLYNCSICCVQPTGSFMRIKSTTEAYSSALAVLHYIHLKMDPGRLTDIGAITTSMDALKIAMENHQREVSLIINILQDVRERIPLSQTEQTAIAFLQEDIRESTYQQTTLEKFQNPLARRSESELAIVLLQNPTKAMMDVVKRISDELLKLIEDLESQGSLSRYLGEFSENYHAIAFGSFKNTPTAQEIKKILQENSPAQLTEIMFIHFKFSQAITRDAAIRRAPVRAPIGELAKIVKDLWPADNPQTFFSEAIAQSWSGRKYRGYIGDELMYRSPLYTAFRYTSYGDRGRLGGLDCIRTNQMGLLLRQQEDHEVGLPKHSSSWIPDSKGQRANLYSPYVLDLIENETVYIAGPSGMASMLLNQMEVLANLESEELKKIYLLAVVAYIVAGGFHSIHEVIGPAQQALNLVPGYLIEVPQKDKLAPPPNYYHFYAQQKRLDPEFEHRRTMAWTKYLNYFSSIYGPKYLYGFTQIHRSIQTDDSILLMIKSPLPPQAPTDTIEKKISNTGIPSDDELEESLPVRLKESILAELKELIVATNRNTWRIFSLFTRFYCSSRITKLELEIAIRFRQQLAPCTSMHMLKTILNAVKSDIKLGQLHGEPMSSLEHCVDRIHGLTKPPLATPSNLQQLG